MLFSLEHGLIALSVIYCCVLLYATFVLKSKKSKTNNFTSKEILDALLFAIPISSALYFLDSLLFPVSFTKILATNAPLLLVLTYVIVDELFWRGFVFKKLNLFAQIGLFAAVTALVFSNGNLNLFINYFISLVAIGATCSVSLQLAGPLAATLTRVFFVIFALIPSDSRSIPLYFILLFAPIAYLYYKKNNLRSALDVLKITPPVQSKKQIAIQAFTLVIATFLILLLEALVLNSAHANDGEKIAATINQFSLIALIVAVTLGPIAEEVFFRGFLQGKFGVVLTAIAFGLLHFGYGSLTEIIGALSIGLLFGWWVKYKNSTLWPVLIAHVIYNAFAITIALNGTGLITW